MKIIIFLFFCISFTFSKQFGVYYKNVCYVIDAYQNATINSPFMPNKLQYENLCQKLIIIGSNGNIIKNAYNKANATKLNEIYLIGNQMTIKAESFPYIKNSFSLNIIATNYTFEQNTFVGLLRTDKSCQSPLQMEVKSCLNSVPEICLDNYTNCVELVEIQETTSESFSFDSSDNEIVYNNIQPNNGKQATSCKNSYTAETCKNKYRFENNHIIFSGYRRLHPETVQESIKSYGNKNGNDIIIEDGITTILSKAFYRQNVKSITFADTIVSLEEYSFADNELLKSIEIPIGITKLPNHVFSNCLSLETVKIPYLVSYISQSAFEGCPHLKKIIYCGANDVVVSRGLYTKEITVLVMKDRYKSPTFNSIPVTYITNENECEIVDSKNSIAPEAHEDEQKKNNEDEGEKEVPVNMGLYHCVPIVFNIIFYLSIIGIVLINVFKEDDESSLWKILKYVLIGIVIFIFVFLFVSTIVSLSFYNRFRKYRTDETSVSGETIMVFQLLLFVGIFVVFVLWLLREKWEIIEELFDKCYWLCIVIFVILIFSIYIVGIIFSADIDTNLDYIYYKQEGIHNYHVFATFFHISWYFEGILTSAIILVVLFLIAIVAFYGLKQLIAKAKEQDTKFEFANKWPFNKWPLDQLPCIKED